MSRRNRRRKLSKVHQKRRELFPGVSRDQRRLLRFETLEDRRMLDAAAGADAIQLFSTSTALFVENQGQWQDESVHYGFDGPGVNIAFTDEGLEFLLTDREKIETGESETVDASLDDPFENPDDFITHSTHFSVSFDGANTVTPVGLDIGESRFNYFVGDQSNWAENVPGFKTVAYEGLYDGIDLHTFGRRDSLKYEFYVAPGADYQQVKVSYEGIEGLWIDEGGALHVETLLGELVDSSPFIYQVIDGHMVEVSGEFLLLDGDTYGFNLTGPYDSSKELVIDPDLEWGTYVGGNDSEFAHGIDVSDDGSVYATGTTSSTGWVSGGFNTVSGDGFLVKISPDGNHLWSTYLSSEGHGIAVDQNGDAFVAGGTGFGSGSNAVLTKVSSSGGFLWDSTFGGSSLDWANSVAVDSVGDAYVLGPTESSSWVSGGYDESHNGGRDAFVAKYSSSGSPLWSTYVGGADDEYTNASAIAVDGSGTVAITGLTYSSNSTNWVSGGFDLSLGGTRDAFLVKLSSSSGGYEWGTYLGGSFNEYEGGVAIDDAGNIYASGGTRSPGWLTGGYDENMSGPEDAFIVKVSNSGTLVWGSYIGGDGYEQAWGKNIALTSTNRVFVTGRTNTSFPSWVSGGFDLDYNGSYDIFIVELSAVGEHVWSSYLGGSGFDYGWGAAVDADENLYVNGLTYSNNSSNWVYGGYDTNLGGTRDSFVAKITNDGAGDTPLMALDIGLLEGTWNFGDSVGDSDTNDYVRLELDTHTDDWEFNLALSNLSADADVQLLDSDGTTLLAYSVLGGVSNESISRELPAGGVYYVRVYPGVIGAETSYELSLSATRINTEDTAPNDLNSARELGYLGGAGDVYEWVGDSDTDDYFQFELSNTISSWNLSTTLTDLAANADIQLLDDQGSVLWEGNNSGILDESDSRALSSGTYYLRVFPGEVGANTDYRISLDAQPVGTYNTIFDVLDFGSEIGLEIRTFIEGLVGEAWTTFDQYLDQHVSTEVLANPILGIRFGSELSLSKGEIVTKDLVSGRDSNAVLYNFQKDEWILSSALEVDFATPLKGTLGFAANEYLVIPGTRDGRKIKAGLELGGGWAVPVLLDEYKIGISGKLLDVKVTNPSLKVGEDFIATAETTLDEAELLSLTGQNSIGLALLDSFGFASSSLDELARDLTGWLNPQAQMLMRAFSVFGIGDRPVSILNRTDDDIVFTIKAKTTADANLFKLNIGVGVSAAIGVAGGVFGQVVAGADIGIVYLYQDTVPRGSLTLKDDVGDTRVLATILQESVQSHFQIESDDVDAFALFSASNQHHRFTIDLGTANDVPVYVFDSDDQLLRQVTLSGTGPHNVSFFSSDPGQYYLFIAAGENTTPGTYSVRWDPGVTDGSFGSGLVGYHSVNGDPGFGTVHLTKRSDNDYAAVLEEQSPVLLSEIATISADKSSLGFSYRIDTPGDGDLLEFRVDGTPLWSVPIDIAQNVFVFVPPIDLSAYIGQTVALEYHLSSTGATNAIVEIDDIMFQESQSIGPQLGVTDSDVSPYDEDLTFPVTTIGDGGTLMEFQLANSGDQGLDITSFAITGADASDFSVVVRDSLESPVDVSSGDFSIPFSQTYRVEVLFDPADTGIRDRLASVSFSTNDPSNSTVNLGLTAVANQRPSVATVSALPGSTLQPAPITIEATGVDDMDGTVSSVEFFVDMDGNGLLDDQVDRLLGTDDDAALGWMWTASSNYLPAAANTYFARAIDDDQAQSIVQSAISTVVGGGPSADFDGDGDVDGIDFLAWQRGFGSSSPVVADGDADSDSDVDGDDLAMWESQYGTVPSPIPGISIEKSTNGEDADLPTGPTVAVGDPVTWTYVVTNTGNVDLTNVAVTDDQGVVPVRQTDLVGDNDNILEVSEIWSYEASGIAVEGQYANLGTVTADDPSFQEVTDNDPSHYFGTASSLVTFDWATIGNPGNSDDSTGYGQVDYAYQISKHEVTVSQYSEFLNAIASTDTNGLYNSDMKITQTGTDGSYSYTPVSGDENRPINYISVLDAMRFVNWLENGQPTGSQNSSTTEDGVYLISDGTSEIRQTGATYFLPSQDEWYKAAYFDPMSDVYYAYPTSNNIAPTAEGPPGGSNSANYSRTSTTDVGAYASSASPSGTFDQGGNVWEWNESIHTGTFGLYRGVRGGSYNDSADKLQAVDTSNPEPTSPTTDYNNRGFRVAAALPAEPVTFDWVTIGNPGNSGELSGAGAGGHGVDVTVGGVGYIYNISKYEVTNGQYIDFLNAVAAEGDTHNLYSASMSGNHGGIDRAGMGTGLDPYVYSPKGGDLSWLERPVNYVSFRDAMRFVNWLENGQPSGTQGLGTTEDGTYAISDGTSEVRNLNATYFIPDEHEWYKAAYHKNDGVTGNYWDYPTGNDSLPTASLPPGGTNSANYNFIANNVTDVGAYVNSASSYGTFDQAGNVWEWNEAVLDSGHRGVRGGGWSDDVLDRMHAANRFTGASVNAESSVFGFRVVSITTPLSATVAGETEPLLAATTVESSAQLQTPANPESGISPKLVDAAMAYKNTFQLNEPVRFSQVRQEDEVVQAPGPTGLKNAPYVFFSSNVIQSGPLVGSAEYKLFLEDTATQSEYEEFLDDFFEEEEFHSVL